MVSRCSNPIRHPERITAVGVPEKSNRFFGVLAVEGSPHINWECGIADAKSGNKISEANNFTVQ